MESGLERRLDRGRSGDWEGTGERACGGGGHPAKLADRQTETFRSAHRS